MHEKFEFEQQNEDFGSFKIGKIIERVFKFLNRLQIKFSPLKTAKNANERFNGISWIYAKCVMRAAKTELNWKLCNSFTAAGF